MLVEVYSTGISYRLSNVVHDDSAVCISVVHRSKRLIPLLSGSIPYLKLDSGVFIQ